MFTGSAATKFVQLPSSHLNQILTLSFVSADCSLSRKVARSHSGFGWEGVPPDPIHLSCDRKQFAIDIEGMGGGGYRVDGYQRSGDYRALLSQKGAKIVV